MSAGKSDYTWAIAAIGAALVALFIAAAATGAAGKTLPTELLALGGALSGALVGVLVPPPLAAQGAVAGASAINSAAILAATQTAARIVADPTTSPEVKANANADLAAVIGTAKQPSAQRQGKAAVEEAIARHNDAAAALGAGPVAQDASAAATAAKADALSAASAAGTLNAILDGGKIIVPAIILGLALYFGISMSDGTVRYANCNVTDVLTSGQTQAPCAGALFQTANAMITLAAAAGGALVGLFAPAPSK